jgi:hypothetical protein
MGKTTLYHPISLQMIRGIAQQNGLYLGRISQVFADRDLEVARYRASIAISAGPINWAKYPPKNIKRMFNQMYLDDIHCVQCWVTRQGVIMLEIEARLSKPGDDPAPELGPEYVEAASHIPF